MILSHQQTGQLTRNLLADIFGNVTTLISFSVAYADAQRLSQQYIWMTNGQKQPVPVEEFVNQRTGEAIGKIAETVFTLRTPLVPKQPNPRLVDYIINRSAQNYGLHSYSRAAWETNIKRNIPKQLPEKGGDDRVEPKDIFE